MSTTILKCLLNSAPVKQTKDGAECSAIARPRPERGFVLGESCTFSQLHGFGVKPVYNLTHHT